MRGKAFRKICNNLFNRITPAYAGKRFSDQRRIELFQDHPRLCGEKSSGFDSVIAAFGITPAYAGKSLLYVVLTIFNWDHPRLCGEKMFCPSRPFDAGSPPPMRGKANRFTCSNCVYRITPAYAGKSAEDTTQLCCHGDHPRLCGEKETNAQKIKERLGSPPPMRGKEL